MADTEGRTDPHAAWIEERQAAFRGAVAGFDPAGTVLVLGHHDADGLSSAAVLARALDRAGRRVEVRVVGRGENVWSPEMAAELRARAPAALIVADLGTRAEPVLPGVPTVLIDHHVPTGIPAEAVLVSGYGLEPQPTTSLLAWWCAGAVAGVDDLLWLAAIGLIGDMAEEAGFAELAEARSRYGITALRNAVSLVNAPRRTSGADASPALAVLMGAEGPKEVTSGIRPETAALLAAKAEVGAAMAEARKAAPRIVGDVALIRLHTGCQVHPLIAQQWKGRLKGKIVIAANAGYAPGKVHFAARAPSGVDLIAFFRAHRPEGADPVHYGNGHAAASGGALPPDQWEAFLAGLGFEAGADGRP